MDQIFKEFLFFSSDGRAELFEQFWKKGPYEEHLCEIILTLGQAASSGEAI